MTTTESTAAARTANPLASASETALCEAARAWAVNPQWFYAVTPDSAEQWAGYRMPWATLIRDAFRQTCEVERNKHLVQAADLERRAFSETQMTDRLIRFALGLVSLDVDTADATAAIAAGHWPEALLGGTRAQLADEAAHVNTAPTVTARLLGALRGDAKHVRSLIRYRRTGL